MMTSFLKKFQILKKKDMESSGSLAPANRGQWDNREAHFSGFQPPGPQDPANQRTSQLLPLLVKPSTSPAAADAKKKAPTQPLVFPELVQHPASQKTPLATYKVDNRRESHPPAEINLPKLFSREKPKKVSTPVKKKPLESMVPIYPELSDEQFKYLWDPRKLHRGRSVRESVEMMDEREVLDTILIYLNHSVQRPSGMDPRQNRRKSDGTGGSQKTATQQKLKQSSQEKIPLYKYFGVKLRDSRNKDVVNEYLHMLLGFAIQDEADREIRIVRRNYITGMPYFVQGVSEAIGIIAFCHLSEILCVLRDFGHLMPSRKSLQQEPTAEDETMKKTFMRAIIMISKALQHTKRVDVHFPHKSELVVCIIEVIEEEPLGSFTVTVLHQAMITATCMTPLKPPLDPEVRSELVNKSVKKVFSLPALKMTKLKAGNPTHPVQSQDFYQQTVSACQNMLTSLLSEVPNLESLQDILIHINGWIDSPKNYERERAVRSTSHLLKFVSEHLDFDVTKEIEKKHKNKKGNVVKWLREDFFIPGPAIFYNNIAKVAQAFGEHLNSNQITDVVLKAIESLTHEDKSISQAAGVLLSSFLEECGMDMEDLPMIVKEIYNHLPHISDPTTKEETLRAVCNLAAKRLNGVVDILLECSVECDDNVAEIWKALVADPYANMKLIRPLLKRLQDEDPLSEVSHRRHSKSIMPMAATNALCLILSLPEASDALQNKFSHLLLALVTQIYFVLGSGKRGSKRSIHLKMTFKQANGYLRRADVKERTVGMAFFTEQDILDVLREWMAQTCPLMRVFSIRGLGHLLQHPLEDEVLEPLLPPLISCAFDPDRNIAKESIKTLQYMFQHLDVEESGYQAVGLLPHLLKYLSDDDPELRRASIVLFGVLLKGVKENQRNSVTENVFQSLVPLLIQLVDPSTQEVARGALCSCANFMKWTDMPQNLFDYELHDRIAPTYINICNYIMWQYKPMLPRMLAQMVEFLKSKNASYREAAALLIACNAQFMKPDVVSTPDVETVFLALRELQGDCDASVTNAAVQSIEEVYRHCGYRINPQLVPNQLMIMLKNSMSKPPFETRH
ncbi:hypothetical protein JD844_008130 [Phrynosoma platyrhinos]|uniref:HEAT repeat-containing protein n=1 Tax=Phrynosoma platyrhinos TaxID=52577 RepID=A0ABQ7TF58_PHRPL|nr:hypothetical protein JD844_008130 [Phrynosoma platyrhinos]